MKKLLALLFLSIGAFASDTTMMGPDVIAWIKTPTGLFIDYDIDYYPYTCNEEIEIDGISYTTSQAFYLFSGYLPMKYGDSPPGLSFKAQVRDSALYLVEARICFEENKPHKLTERTASEKIPLRLIFPEALSDTMQAAFMNQAIILFPDSIHYGGAILVKKGKVIRSWIWPDAASVVQNFDSTEFYHFEDHEMDFFDSSAGDPQNPKFIALMNRLRPYYGEKLWDIAQEMLGNR